MLSLNIPGLKKGGNDSKYFTTNKKGEVHELKEELHDAKPEVRRDAVKKVIAAMTVGKDVSTLFPDVLNCMQTASVELKKLVYLYLINYAKTNPDLAILAVNTFRRDANDSNPLIRALSIRTMGCIRVDKITEYLCDPLRRACQDTDPYVRKTAAICVAKLFDIAPGLAEEQGFLELLNELLSDANPTVVANAVAALSEIAAMSGDESAFAVTPSVLSKLLAALGECAEWGQVFILEALSAYRAKNAREAESIVERITPRLQHSNSAVVMASVKIIVQNLDLLAENDELVKTLSRKLSPPLVTLLSAEPEIQYVALRNINLIVQRHPAVLSGEIRVFFCRYNDPIYVKMEKLELMVLLANERTAEQVLLELKEYATEVDVDFVRKAVRAIGRIAIKLERAAEKCINVLLDLIKTRVNYVVQESIIVIKDIFRRYPNRYESIIATLCDNLDALDEPEAKAAMVWIVGEYAGRIDNADELLENFLDSFADETAEVQLQLLTATVKLFLKRPDKSKELMENVLALATEHSDNPDLRDRGYIYWRLLSTDTEAAKRIVLSEKPVISDDSAQLEPEILEELINNISTLSSVYHKPPSAFVKQTRTPLGQRDEEEEEEEEDGDEDEDLDEDGASSSKAAAAKKKVTGGGSSSSSSNSVSTGTATSNVEDLLGFGGGGGAAPAAPAAPGGDFDLLGGFADKPQAPAQLPQAQSLPQLFEGQGLRIAGRLARRGQQPALELYVTNLSCPSALQEFKIQLNKNALGLAPQSVAMDLGAPVPAGQGRAHTAALTSDANKLAPSGQVVDVALKVLAIEAVVYFKVPIDLANLVHEAGAVDKKDFINDWKALGADATKSVAATVRGIVSSDVAQVAARLQQRNVFSIATRQVGDDQQVGYFSATTVTGAVLLIELTFKTGFDACKLTLRSQQLSILPLAQAALEKMLMR